jgi:hypothetical protein
MKTPNSPELVNLCETRLREITKVDSADLTEFAECRLIVLGVSPSSGEDLTQRAFQQVLQGLETDQGGRQPRLVDVANKPAFLNYLRGVISSLVYGMTTKCGFRAEHRQWDDEMPAPGGTGNAPAKDVELNDIRNQLFPRLRALAPSRLLPTIAAWESVFEHTDRIPTRGKRANGREVKNLAKKVLSELGAIR